VLLMTFLNGCNMETILRINIYADTKDKAVDILADVLLRVEKQPDDNLGEWHYKFDNLSTRLADEWENEE